MALSIVDSFKRSEVGAAISTPGTRGLVLNGYQVELALAAKSTGDTTGNVTLTGIQRPKKVYVVPTRGSSGANVSAIAFTEVAFTHTDNTTIALSDLGDWTVGMLYICGRDFSFA